MNIYLQIVRVLFCALLVVTSSVSTAEEWKNIDGKVEVTQYQSVFNRVFRTYITNLDIENKTSTPIVGDIRLIVQDSNLSPKEPDGFDENGNPFYLINSDRIGSSKVSLQVNFVPSGRTKPSFNAKVELLDNSVDCSATYCFEDAVFFTNADEPVNISVNYDNSNKAWSVSDENNDYSPHVNYDESRKNSIWLTHLLYPASEYSAVSNEIWSDTEINYPNKVSSEAIALGERTPLILIHGWQGGGFQNNYVGSLQANTTPETYFQEFLAFYNGSSETAKQLKEKYKLFLYKYPAFEHITYNGRMLGEAIFNIPELKSYVGSGKKIKIVAHSMGGLVARSFIEEHGVGFAESIFAIDLDFDEKGTFNQVHDGKDVVDALITLATPHHGSPGAGKKWADIGDIVKVRTTPGALDLMWDDFDGGMSHNLCDAASHPIAYTCESTAEDNLFWFTERNNLENFDLIYGGWDYELSKVDGRRYRHPNPWLRDLNQNSLQVNNNVSYLLYGGGVTTTEVFVWQDNLMQNTLSNGIGMREAFQSVGNNARYVLNDGVVPTRSAFMDQSGTWNIDSSNISRVLSDFPDFRELIYKEGTYPVGLKTIKYRYFHDYDHDKMRGGAGNTDSSIWIDSLSYDSNDNWNDSDTFEFLDNYLSKIGTYFVGDYDAPEQRLANEPLFLALAEDLGVSLPAPSSTVLYEEDFDSTPNFTSYDPNAYWDSSQENYYVRTRDDLNGKYWGYSPSFGTVDASKPVTLEIDITFENQDWGTYPGVRFYAKPPTEIHASDNRAIFRIDNAYRNSYVRQIGIYDNAGNQYYTPSVLNGSWHKVKIETDGLGSADITVINTEDGSIIFQVTSVDFVIDDFSYMGVGYYNQPDYGRNWSPIRIDNIKITGSSNENKFAITSVYSSETTNIFDAVQNEFGSEYEVADWNDLIEFEANGGDLRQLMDDLGIEGAMVTKGGNRFYSGSRQYYIDWSDRPNQTPYGSFASHGNIGQLYLGSWYLNMPVLVKKVELNSFENFATIEVNIDNLENDLVGAVQSILPNGYRIADWNDLIAYSSNNGDLEDIWDGLGGAGWMITRNGDPTYANNIYYNGTRFNRFYFGSWSYRPGQTPHSGFLSHAHIGQMHLGSWSPRGSLLIIKD